MRARWSLFDAWFFGVIAFIAVTASLVLAFSIAITGPPTDEEMAGVDAALDRASRDIAVLARQIGDEACVQLPPEATTGLCPQAASAPTETPRQRELSEEPEAYPLRPSREPQTEVLAQSEPAADLLGSSDEPSATAQPQSQIEPQMPRARPAPSRDRRAPRPPIVRAEIDRIPPLPQREAETVADVPQVADTEIATPRELMEEAIYERDAPSRREPAAGNDDDRYAPDQYADEEEGYFEDEDYERRERRRERRRQRQDEYYGGW